MSYAVNTITQTLSGPERFDCASGISTRTFSCPSTQGAFTMNVVNGDGNGANTISSAIITINGTTVVGNKDFNANVTQISKTLTNLVKGYNTLTVQTKTCGAGSYLTVTITGVYALDMKIASPVAGAQVVARTAAVSGTYAVYSGATFTVKVNNVTGTAVDGAFSVPNVPLVPGSNVLNAVITTTDGLSDSDNVTINSNLPPVAEAGADMNVRMFDNVVLDGRDSADPEGAQISYRWSLASRPSGSAAEIINPTSVMPWFTPDREGIYVPQLIVNDDYQDGAPDNLAVTAMPPNTRPTAVAGPDQSAITGTPVQIDGSSSYDPDGDPITFIWRFISRPEGSLASMTAPHDNLTSFVPDLDGNYLVGLVVNDGLADSFEDNVAIVASTPNAPPIAFAGQDQFLSKGGTIQLDGTGSYDPENQPLSFAWTIVSLPAGSASVLDNTVSPMPTLPADKAGDYVVRLRVHDGETESEPDTVVATAVNDPPVALASVPAPSVPIRAMTTLDGSASYDPNGDPLNYAWSVGSAPAGSTAAIENSTSATALFMPDVAGSYTFNLVVHDGTVSGAPAAVGITAYVPTVAVPSVTGMTQTEAQATIAGAILETGAISTAYSDNVAVGVVLDQSPAAGTIVFQWSSIDLVVSSGPKMVAVPGVVGLPQSEAQAALVGADLTVGSATSEYSGFVAEGNVIRQSPAAGSVVIHGTPVDLAVSLGPTTVAVPDMFGKPQSVATALLAAAGFPVGTVTPVANETAIPGTVLGQEPASGALLLQGTPVALTVASGPPDVPLPPDPATVAPPLSTTEAGNLLRATEFLYTGANPIQTGVSAGTIDIRRAALIRGRVGGPDNSALPGVIVSIAEHGEYGRTITRQDGMFDLVVNGGGMLRLTFSKAGYLSVERQVDLSWQEAVTAPDVVIIPYDNQVTSIDLSQGVPVQVARGSVVTDENGARQATLLFSQGTNASIVMQDGSTRPITNMSVRATEFTVGSNRTDRMPAELPPTSAYTYCAEFSIDEAVAAGASKVTFDRPVIGYLENFIDFPVGGSVPSGYFDRQRGVWVPSPNGRVIKILGTTAGLSDLDISGDGLADNTALLATLGIYDSERAKLATLYPAGTTLWRVPLTHFSPHDWNWAYALPPDAVDPTLPSPEMQKFVSDPCTRTGSIIQCENQVLGEIVPISGTPFELRYNSDRAMGRVDAYTMKVNLSGTSIPASLLRIVLVVNVAGKQYVQSFPPLPNQSTMFSWDGKDVYGRPVQGQQNAVVQVGYVYRAVYSSTASFIMAGYGNALKDSFRTEISLWQTWQTTTGNFIAKDMVGGWTVDVHHAYDPLARTLHLGNGSRRNALDENRIITTVAGTGVAGYNGDNKPATQAMLNYPMGVDVGPDGSIYVAEMNGNRIRRILPDGVITTVAGTGTAGFNGDGIPATQATLRSPRKVRVNGDGSFVVSDGQNGRVRRVGTDGMISSIGPVYNNPHSLTAGRNGSIYVGYANANLVYRISADNVTTWTMGTTGGTSCIKSGKYSIYSTSVGIAYAAALGSRRDGSLVIASDFNDLVHNISPDGFFTHFAGGGSDWYCQTIGAHDADGYSALQTVFGGISGLDFGPDDSMYLTELRGTVRRVSSNRIVTTVAGNYTSGYGGDGGPATIAALNNPQDVAVGPDGSLYIADSGNHRIRRVAPPFPWLSEGELAIASEGGSELYVFDSSGKHLRTRDTTTGATLYRFEYSPIGRLVRILDVDNNATRIERDGTGSPLAIIAPGEQRTPLTSDPNGYLETISDPGGNTRSFAYSDLGLLTGMIDENGNPHAYHYDSMGRLDRDDDPEGGFTILSRSNATSWTDFKVTATTAINRQAGYAFKLASDMTSTRTITDERNGKTTLVTGTGGQRTITLPDGVVTTAVEKGDPRFGMESPVLSSATVRMPSGLQLSASASRSASLSNPNDPLSVISLTESYTHNGKTASQLYTAATRQVASTSPAGRVSNAWLDDAGRVTTASVDPAVDNVVFSYSSSGRLASTSQGGQSATFGYDALGRLVSITAPDNNAVAYGYDNADRVASVRLPSGRTYGFGYDPAGNTTSITMPNGAVHALGYSKIHLDNSYTPPGNLPYDTKYNADREWVRTTLPSGRAIDGGYDNGGRIRSTVYPEASIAFGYTDNTDRVMTFSRTSAADNATQTMAFSYDGFLTTRIASSGASTVEYRYAYNNNFTVSSYALDNVWTSLARDNDGLLTQYGRYTIGRSGPAGAPSSLTDNTLSVGYTYDNFGRLATRTHTIAGQQRYQITLGYDNVGRISRKTEVVAGTSHIFDYGYDLDGQLIDVFKDGSLVEHYGYDNNSNRTNTLSASATYDDQDRLIQRGGLSYTFDDDGYLTNRGADTFAYSARGELLSATAGGQAVTYQYDAMARRVARTASGATTQYLYGNPGQPFQLTASRAPDNTLTTYFYETSGNLFAFERAGQRYYVATDHLGTPKVVTDNAGNVVKQAEYDAWGVKLSDTNPAFDIPVGFAGGIPENATSMVRFGFRDYEPATGRWDARDPILFEGGQGNLYTYVANSPVNDLDPTGLATLILPQGTMDLYDGWNSIVNNAWLPSFAKTILYIDPKSMAEASLYPACSLSVGGKITGYTKHGINQAISREGVGVSTKAILDAVKNPERIKHLEKSVKYIGKQATVILNDAGKVISTWARGRGGWR